MISLREAARITGKSRQAVHKAIKDGRVRAEKQSNGQLLIDASSLASVYEVDVKRGPKGDVNGTSTRQQAPGTGAYQLESLRTKTEMLERMLEDARERVLKVEADRDRQIARSQEQAERWQAEADHWRLQATTLLTDQRAPQDKAPSRSGYWRGLWAAVRGRR